MLSVCALTVFLMTVPNAVDAQTQMGTAFTYQRQLTDAGSPVKRGDKTYKYLQIVEAYRDNGRTTQRVGANLGRLDQLDGKLDDLLVLLSKYAVSGRAKRFSRKLGEGAVQDVTSNC